MLDLHQASAVYQSAEGVRFELTVPCGTSVFKTDAISRAMRPLLYTYWRWRWDSNPREDCSPSTLAVCCFQPLSHPTQLSLSYPISLIFQPLNFLSNSAIFKHVSALKLCSRSLTDRMRDCGSLDTGSIPVGST